MAVVIEDEEDIRHLLETVLTQAGFMVVATSNGLDGLAAVRKHEPLVTTLDVNMPGMDGFETARRIREFSSTYIVMLTALAEEIDTLQGLESGADDYINKPFRPRELRARIEAMLRRPRATVSADATAAATAQVTPTAQVTLAAPAAPPVEPATHWTPAPTAIAEPEVLPVAPSEVTAPYVAPVAVRPAAVPPVAAAPVAEPSYLVPPASTPAPAAAAPQQQLGGSWLEHNKLRLNVESRVVLVDNAEIELTRSEFDLLVAIIDSHRRVRSKADLVLLLRGESYVTSHFVSDADKRAIEVHMANLRKKLGDNSSTPRWIETVRGVGYRLTAPDSQ